MPVGSAARAQSSRDLCRPWRIPPAPGDRGRDPTDAPSAGQLVDRTADLLGGSTRDGAAPVNDVYGHQRGDVVLQAVADELRKSVRDGDLVYRLGGEEFLVLLPGREAVASEAIAERLRAAIATARPAGLEITASLGVSVGPGHAGYAKLFAEADAALYEAQRQGRNRVIRHDPDRVVKVAASHSAAAISQQQPPRLPAPLGATRSRRVRDVAI